MARFGDLFVSAELSVPAWELSEAFIRSAGPGGQNVNKVSSAVQLTWSPAASSLPAGIKSRFLAVFASRLTTDGRLIIEASEHRSQLQNRAAARRRLADMILEVTTPPKRRVATKPTAGSVRRRLAAKRYRGIIKAQRGAGIPED